MKLKPTTIDDLRRAWNIQNEMTEEEIKKAPRITEEEWKQLLQIKPEEEETN